MNMKKALATFAAALVLTFGLFWCSFWCSDNVTPPSQAQAEKMKQFMAIKAGDVLLCGGKIAPVVHVSVVRQNQGTTTKQPLFLVDGIHRGTVRYGELVTEDRWLNCEEVFVIAAGSEFSAQLVGRVFLGLPQGMPDPVMQKRY